MNTHDLNEINRRFQEAAIEDSEFQYDDFTSFRQQPDICGRCRLWDGGSCILLQTDE